MPQSDVLRLSNDKAYCMAEMKRSMSSCLAETAWPKVQYLWKLHPLFQWVNDKAGLLYGRGVAPVVGLQDRLKANETIFLLTGSIPNRRSTPLVDEWFGLLYDETQFVRSMSMNEVLKQTGFRSTNIPNTGSLTEQDIRKTEELRRDAVKQAGEYMQKCYKEYKDRMDPLLNEELDKLSDLEKRHKAYQMSLFESERKKSEQERMVDALFERFVAWVSDSLEIENSPYIRIVAVLKGVAK